MSDAPRAVCPGEPTRSDILLYTQPMMFMFTVLPWGGACKRRRSSGNTWTLFSLVYKTRSYDRFKKKKKISSVLFADHNILLSTCVFVFLSHQYFSHSCALSLLSRSIHLICVFYQTNVLLLCSFFNKRSLPVWDWTGKTVKEWMILHTIIFHLGAGVFIFQELEKQFYLLFCLWLIS